MSWEQPTADVAAKPKLLDRIVAEAFEPLTEPYRWHLGRYTTEDARTDKTGATLDQQLVLSITRPGMLGWFMASFFASVYVFDDPKSEAGLLQWLQPDHREGSVAVLRARGKDLQARLEAHLELNKVLESTEEDRR